MKASELGLPEHLYQKTTSPCGTRIKVTFAPDKLIAWSEQGRGDAIDRLCHQAYASKLGEIAAWEDDRIRQLQDQWLVADNDDAYGQKEGGEDHFQLAREAIAREADMKRASAKDRVADHRSAVEKLVQDAREFIATHQAPQEEDHLVEYVFLIGVASALVYVLLN